MPTLFSKAPVQKMSAKKEERSQAQASAGLRTAPAQGEYVDLPDNPGQKRRYFRSIDEFSPTLSKEPVCRNPYAAFGPKPQNIHFESQDPDERIVLFVRKHPITNIGWIATAIILGILPLLLRFIPLIDFFPERFQLMSVVAWYVLLMGYVLENFLSWFFNVNIFTDERIIDIDFYSLIYKKISTAQIDRVEDVTSSIGGFLGSVLNYGTVDIQTAAQERELSFEQVPSPEKVMRVLNELILEEEQEKLEGRAR